MTNTVKLETGVFKNADGLRVKYGLSEALKGVAGVTALKDDERILYVDIDWTRLPAFAAAGTGNIYGSEPESSIPTGAIITAASLETTTAFTGTGGTLSLGLVDRDGADQSLNTGFFSAVSIATLGAAGTVNASSGGALNAAATTKPLYLWAQVGTATFTAGAARLKITYNLPRSV